MRSRLSWALGGHRRLVVWIAASSILAGFTEAGMLALIAEIATSLVGRHGSKGGHGVGSLFNFHAGTGTLLLVAIGLLALRTLLQVPLSILPARIASSVQARLRTDLFDSFSRASWSIQSGEREGQVQEVMTGQVMQAVSGSTAVIALITSSFQFAVLMVFALLLNVLAAAMVAALTVCLFAVLRPLRSISGETARELSAAQVRYAGGVAESNRVAEEVHVFGVAAAQRAQVDALVARSQKFFYRAQLLTRVTINAYQSVIYAVLLAGIGVLYIAGGRHAGSFGGVVLVLLRAGTAGQNVQAAYQNLVQALPFVARTQETLERYRANAETTGEAELATITDLRMEAVGFSYESGVPVLHDISFEVAAGEVIGIVGPSGAGKSTLVQLLLRLREPIDGSYLVNGLPAESILARDWHRLVAYVPQEPRLLHATVSENIRFFRDIDMADVERAARLARIHDDIMSWQNGYDTLIGPRADAVSGGQQQRICLARALAARPAVLILDEPTSALDPHSEAQISASLAAIQQELTLFIVAHRMSTLDMCNRVMVIVDGRMAGFDTRAELNRSNEYFRGASALASAGAPSDGSLPEEPLGGAPTAVAEPLRRRGWLSGLPGRD